jgi:hypothetical protein
VEVYLHAFLSSALNGSQRSASISDQFKRAKKLQYPSNTKLDGSQSKAGRLGEEKHFMPLLEFEVLLPGSPARTISYHIKAKIRFDMDK